MGHSVHYHWAEMDPEKFIKDVQHLYCFKDLELKYEEEDRNKKLGA